MMMRFARIDNNIAFLAVYHIHRIVEHERYHDFLCLRKVLTSAPQAMGLA